MEGLTGLETVQAIRECLHLAPDQMPIIRLHSSADDQALRDRCKQLGVQFDLTRPVKARELHHLLQHIYTAEATVAAVPSLPSELLPMVDASQPVTVLVAEDVMTNMMLIRILLKKLIPGVEVLEEHNGVEAVQTLQQQAVDLVLMDVQMPELDGLEATRLIRERERLTGAHVPISALTAGAFREERERCMTSGMDDFQTKPIQAAVLAEVQQRYLSQVAPAEPSVAAKSPLRPHVAHAAAR